MANEKKVTANEQQQTIAQLRDEIQILKKRLSEHVENTATPRKEIAMDEIDRKYKELKDKHHQLLLDRNHMQQDLVEKSEKLRVLQSEIKKAQKHRDLASRIVDLF